MSTPDYREDLRIASEFIARRNYFSNSLHRETMLKMLFKVLETRALTAESLKTLITDPDIDENNLLKDVVAVFSQEAVFDESGTIFFQELAKLLFDLLDVLPAFKRQDSQFFTVYIVALYNLCRHKPPELN
jgi:hypothetical protein